MSKNTVTIGLKYSSGIVMEAQGHEPMHINGFNSAVIIGGHGLTYNVPKDLWEAWRAQFAKHPLVTNGLIFAHEEEKSVKAEAEEKKATKSKTEKLDKLKPTDKPDALAPVEGSK